MIALLGLLARLSVILGFVGLAFASISDLIMRTNYLTILDSMIDLGSTKVKIVLGLLAIIYLVIFFLSYINKLLIHTCLLCFLQFTIIIPFP